MNILAALPGPSAMPILGWRGSALRFLADPIGYMDRLPARTGLNAFVAGGSPPILLTTPNGQGSVFALGAAANQAVLSDMASYQSRPVPGPPESASFARRTAGLFSMNLEKHQQQRRLVQPAFHRQRVAGYHADMVDITTRALDTWAVGETRDLLADVTRLSVTIANKSLFGVDADGDTFDLGARILEVIALATSPVTMLPASFPFNPRKRLVTLAADVEARLRALVERKRADPDANDVLADLVRARDEAGDTLTDDELIGQTFLLFFAGHDTTRSALAWTLALLAQHPDILGEVHEELRETLHGAPPSLQQLTTLPHLDAVVKESLRLFPPAPWTLRETAAPVDLCGTQLPAGVEVMLSYYHTHRDPDLYPDPNRFRPARWAGLTPPPYAYVPFGGGARLCVGAAFASQELRLVLAMLLQRFHPVFPQGARVDRHTRLVLTPAGGLRLVLRAPGDAGAPIRLGGNIREMVELPG